MSEGDPNRQYGWDTSHYDDIITVDTAMAALAEGITFATAKVGEGRSYDDPADAINLSAFREAGIPLIGGYYVPRSGDVAPQVDNCLRLADRDEPWWHEFPGWFWQVDLERWTYDSVPAAAGIEFARQLRDRTGRVVILYASRGQYGDQLAGWDGSLWNADYPSSTQAPFADLYPGDTYKGWRAYSGQVPAVLQYASSATIAGRTTCDANAFRGSLAQLRTLLTGGDDMALSDDDAQALIWRVEALINNRPQVVGGPLKGELNAVHTALAAISTPAVTPEFATAVAGALAPLLPKMPTLAEIAKAVNDDGHRRSAD